MIEIFSIPSSNKLPVGAAIILICAASQTNELARKKPDTRPRRIEWFDPQGRLVGNICWAESPVAARLNCTLLVYPLTEGKFGNYTCKASNGYSHCSNKRFHIERKG